MFALGWPRKVKFKKACHWVDMLFVEL